MSQPEGLCARCTRPGACCQGFTLSHSALRLARTGLDAAIFCATVQTQDTAGRLIVGVPFVPTGWRTAGTHEPAHPEWREGDAPVFDCTALGEDGRCTIYDQRPELCRLYEPGCDALCVMHVPEKEKGDEREDPP